MRPTPRRPVVRYGLHCAPWVLSERTPKRSTVPDGYVTVTPLTSRISRRGVCCCPPLCMGSRFSCTLVTPQLICGAVLGRARWSTPPPARSHMSWANMAASAAAAPPPPPKPTPQAKPAEATGWRGDGEKGGDRPSHGAGGGKGGNPSSQWSSGGSSGAGWRRDGSGGGPGGGGGGGSGGGKAGSGGGGGGFGGGGGGQRGQRGERSSGGARSWGPERGGGGGGGGGRSLADIDGARAAPPGLGGPGGGAAPARASLDRSEVRAPRCSSENAGGGYGGRHARPSYHERSVPASQAPLTLPPNPVPLPLTPTPTPTLTLTLTQVRPASQVPALRRLFRPALRPGQAPRDQAAGLQGRLRQGGTTHTPAHTPTRTPPEP